MVEQVDVTYGVSAGLANRKEDEWPLPQSYTTQSVTPSVPSRGLPESLFHESRQLIP